MKAIKNRFGFTLIELLVVVSIIGVLATLVVANMNTARGRARDAARKSDLKNLSTALRLYFNDKGIYPANNASGEIMGCGGLGTTLCNWGDPWTVGTTTYMPAIPKDPISNQVYKYERGVNQDTFTLSACLENESDTTGSATSDSSWCSTQWQFQIQI